MALFKKWRKTNGQPATQIVAPISGTVIPLKNVPDAILANKVIGDGVAIEPTGSQLVAPCDGVIYRIAPSGHAFSITTLQNEELLVHFGLDTVQLKGAGFTPRVQAGEQVVAGQVIVDLDLDIIRQKAASLITVILDTNPTQKLQMQTSADALVVAGDTPIFTIQD